MRHAFRFPDHIKRAVREHVRNAVTSINPQRFRQEPSYTNALLARLEGVAYDDFDGHVSIRATSVDSIAPGAAEGWSGADFAITATISDPNQQIEKAILVQAKLGDLEELDGREFNRLLGQVRDMKALTRSPKVMVAPLVDGIREPKILSGRRLLEGTYKQEMSLDDYVVARITPTLDGDTRRAFVDAVQDSSLQRLRIHAEIRGRRTRVPVEQRVKVLS
jgi:hypothetical protein